MGELLLLGDYFRRRRRPLSSCQQTRARRSGMTLEQVIGFLEAAPMS
jgi:hypothetical protein